ncbi:MAG: PKD domain-containing protein [Bacteroidota bacterium]
MKRKITLLAITILTGISCSAANYYWVGGSGNWSDFNNHWANTSGGSTFHTQVPQSTDNVYFDALSFTTATPTVTIDQTIVQCADMTWIGVFNTPTLLGASSDTMRIFGSLTLSVGMNFNFNGQVSMEGFTSGNTISSAGNTINGSLAFNGIGGSWNLSGVLSVTKVIYLNNGTLNTYSQTINAAAFYSSTTSNRTINMGFSTFNLSGNSGNLWSVNPVGMTLNAGTSTINGACIGTGGRFYGGGFTYNDLFFTGSAVGILNDNNTLHNVSFAADGIISGTNTFHDVSFAGNANIYGDPMFGPNSFNNITMAKNGTFWSGNIFNNLSFSPGYTYTLQAGQIQSVGGTICAQGTAALPIRIQSSSVGAPTTILKPSGTICWDYVRVSDITATGGATFNAGLAPSNSQDLGGNTGLLFTGGCTFSCTSNPAPCTLIVSASAIGSTVTVTASGGTPPYTGTGTFTVLTSGVYSYTVTDMNGCTKTATVTVSTSSPCTPPGITMNPTPTSVCAGNIASFSVMATGTNLTYQWQVNPGAGFSNLFNNISYNGVTTNTLNITAATTALNGYQYRCVVSSDVCVSTSGPAILTVTSCGPCTPPIIMLNPNPASVCAGSTTSFSVVATGTNLTYQWQVNQGMGFTNLVSMIPYTGVTSSLLSITGVTTALNGYQYRCVVNSDVCLTTSGAGTLTVTSCAPCTPPIIMLNPNPVGVCAGSTTSFSVMATGTNLTYQWQVNPGAGFSNLFNTIPYNGVTTNTLSIIATPTWANGYQYRCVVSSGTCASESNGAILTVNPSPIVTVNSAAICAGQTAILTATIGSNMMDNFPTGTENYSWSTGATTNSISVSPAATTNYTVIVTRNGCSSTTIATVTLNPPPTVTVNSTTICSGQTATLIATIGTIIIPPPPITPPPAIPPPSGITPPPPIPPPATLNTYIWSNGATTNSISVSPVTTTTYTVTITNNGCSSTAVATVTVNPLPIVNVNSATINSGQTATLIASGATGYSWSTGETTNPISVSPTSTTPFTVTGTTNSCSNTAIATVTVNPVSTLAIIPAGPFNETDLPVTLSASIGGGTWSGIGITDAINGIFSPSLAGPGKHTITYFLAGPFGGTATTEIMVNALIDGDFIPQNQPNNEAFATIFDRFGNSYTLDDISVKNNPPPPPSLASCTAGYFNLDFVGSGWSGPNSTPMQDLLCQLFNDVSALIQPSQCNGVSPIVNIKVLVPSNMPPNALGAATPYFTICCPSDNTGIIDGDVWKAINSGVNDPTLYDGELHVNLSQNWNFNATSTSFPTQYDAYSVYLHEVIHLLGFASLIGPNGQSGAPGLAHHYSRFDSYLNSNNNGQLITWNNCYNATFNALALGDITNTNQCSNIIFNAPVAGQQPVTANSPYQQGTSLSHFNNNCPGATNYVMAPTLGLGQFHRVPTLQEVNTLEDLGYQTTGVYGTSPTVPTTGLPAGGQVVAGVDDGFGIGCGSSNLQICATQTILVSPLDNDIGVGGGTGTVTCLRNTGGFGSFTIAGTTFTFNPGGQAGIATFTYIPVSSTGRIGNITCIRIIVSACGATCSTLFNCNQICNPEFTDPQNCFDPNDPSFDPSNSGCGYCPFCITNGVSGNWFQSHGSPQIRNNIGTAPVPAPGGVGLPETVLMAAAPPGTGNREGIITPLINVQPGVRYIFSYSRMRMSSGGSSFPIMDNMHIRLLNSTQLNGIAIPTLSTTIPAIPPVNFEILHETNVTSTNWEQVTVCFATPSNGPAYDWLWIYPEQNVGSPFSIILVDWVQLMEDNFTAGNDQTITCGDVIVGVAPLCAVKNVSQQWAWGSNTSPDPQLTFAGANQLNQTTTFTLNRSFPTNPGGVANSCISSDNVTITLNNPVQLIANATNACGTNNGTANVTVSGGALPYTFEWKDINNNILTTQSVTGLAPGTYTVTVTDANGCSNTATATVTVKPLPVVTATPSSQTICSGTAPSIVLSSNIAGTTYAWTVAQTNVSGGSPGSGTTISQTLTATVPGTAVYTITPSAGGCVGTPINVTITVNLAPVAAFSFIEFDNVEDHSVSFAHTPVSGTTYTWNFMDGTTLTTTTASIVNHTFLLPGYYQVTLTATNGCGISSSSQIIYIIPLYSPFSPTVLCLSSFPYSNSNPNVPTGDHKSISGLIPWNAGGTIRIKGTLTIQTGATLTISNNTIVEFGPQGRVIVMRGAKLIINNAILRGTQFPNCNGIAVRMMWQGIEVWGIKSSGLPSNQGLISIQNNALIEDAYNAVMLGKSELITYDNGQKFKYNGHDPNFGGGIIQAANSTFNRCNVSINFWEYPYSNYLSYITACKFTCKKAGLNANLLDPYFVTTAYPHTGAEYPNPVIRAHNPFYNSFSPPTSSINIGRSNAGITLYGRRTIIIKDNIFEYSEAGIVGSDSKFSVIKGTGAGNTFTDHKTCILEQLDNYNILFAGNNFSNSTFKKFEVGIYISSGLNDVIKDNDFNPPLSGSQTDNQSGITLHFTRNFKVVDNRFTRLKSGIYCRGSGTVASLIGYATSGNTFTKCYEPIITYLNNNMLNIRCNNFDNIITFPTEYWGRNWDIHGTLPNQGFGSASNKKAPAGNRFQIKTPVRNQIHAATPVFKYYPHIEAITKPTKYNSGSTVTIQPGLTHFTSVSDVCTPSAISTGGGYTHILLAKRNNITLLEQEYINIQNTIDHGQTGTLLSAIQNNNTPVNALKNQLISNTPLSDTVLTAFINRPVPLPPPVMRDVLKPNSPVSEKVLPHLQAKIAAMPPPFAESINNYQVESAPYRTLTTLLREVAVIENERQLLLNEAVSYYIDNDSVPQAIALLEQESSLEAKQALVGTYMEQGDYTTALQKLNSIPLIADEDIAFKNLYSMYINLALQQKTLWDMDSLQQLMVREIAALCPGSIATVNAQVVLFIVFGESSVPCPDNDLRSINDNSNTQLTQLSISLEDIQYLGNTIPNPFSNTTSIPYFIPKGSKGILSVNDMQGDLIKTYNLTEGSNKLEVSLSEYGNGLYFYTLSIDDDRIVRHKKMILNK